MTGWGSSQNFGAPSQNFGAPVQNWGTGGNPQWTAPAERSAPLYDANGIAARQDADRYCYGPSGWGAAQQQQAQPTSTPAQSSNQSFYKSPNDWLDAPRLTSIVRFSPEGYPLHAFSGAPVCPEWVHVMTLTYPDRTWEELCSVGELPRPKVATKAVEEPSAAASSSGRWKGNSSVGEVVGQSSGAAAGGRVPKMLAPHRNPPKLKSHDEIVSGIKESLDKAKSGTKNFIVGDERANKASAEAKAEFTRAGQKCAEHNEKLVRNCFKDLGWTPKNQARDVVTKTVTGYVTKSTQAQFLGKAVDTIFDMSDTPSCIDAFKEITQNKCMMRTIQENARKAARNRSGKK